MTLSYFADISEVQERFVNISQEVADEFVSYHMGLPKGLHPYEVIDRYAGSLSERDRHIFQHRVAPMKQNVTLRALGDRYGITRERVRQIENALRGKIARFMASDEASTVGQFCTSARMVLGVAAPKAFVKQVMEGPGGIPNYSDLVLRAAGPYVEDKGWLVIKSALENDPTEGIKGDAGEYGLLDESKVREKLLSWGLRPHLHRQWLSRDEHLVWIEGQLVVKPRRNSSRMATALAILGSPAEIWKLMNMMDATGSVHTITTDMARDDNLVRVGLNNWGLASWNMPVYKNVPTCIENVIQRMGGRARHQDVIKETMAFGVTEQTVRAYLYVPKFIIDGEFVRLRTPQDPEWSISPDCMYRNRGVYRLGPEQCSKVVEINRDVLRGSGTMASVAVAYLLGLKPNDELVFTSAEGDSLLLAYSDTAVTGPNFGSMRKIASRMGLKLGDRVSVVLDRSDMTFSMNKLAETDRSWNAVSHLMGTDGRVNRERLAYSLCCKPEEVDTMLWLRKDPLIDVLPQAPRRCLTAYTTEKPRAPSRRKEQTSKVNHRRLRMARDAIQLSLKEMSEQTGLHVTTLWRYESNTLQPPMQAIEEYARVTGRPTEWFMRRASSRRTAAIQGDRR